MSFQKISASFLQETIEKLSKLKMPTQTKLFYLF